MLAFPAQAGLILTEMKAKWAFPSIIHVFQGSRKLWERLQAPPSLDTKITQHCLACWHPSEVSQGSRSLHDANPAFPTAPAASSPAAPVFSTAFVSTPPLDRHPLLPCQLFAGGIALGSLSSCRRFFCRAAAMPPPRTGIPPFPPPTAWPRSGRDLRVFSLMVNIKRM